MLCAAGFGLYIKRFAMTKSDKVLWRAISRKRKRAKSLAASGAGTA
jgi:hypothetical protein